MCWVTVATYSGGWFKAAKKADLSITTKCLPEKLTNLLGQHTQISEYFWAKMGSKTESGVKKITISGIDVPVFSYKTRDIVTKNFKDMNDGLYVDFIQVPLICLYTHKRIDVPCRTLLCKHIQCFDISALLQKPRPLGCKWTCPICGIKSSDVYIDGYIKSVLQQTSSEDIQIYADCTWASVKDPDESHTDKAPKDGSDEVIDLTNETIIDLTELDVTIDEIDKTLQNSANDDECLKS